MAQERQLSLRALVKGRVQGVGFRIFVQEKAEHLDLTGWVRNLSGGEVELEARGPRSGLEALLGVLRQGPPASRVEDVDSQWLELPPEREKGFRIRG